MDSKKQLHNHIEFKPENIYKKIRQIFERSSNRIVIDLLRVHFFGLLSFLAAYFSWHPHFEHYKMLLDATI